MGLSAKRWVLALALSLSPAALFGQEALDVTIEGLDGEMLPDELAFCIPDASAHQAPGRNVQPAISWSAGPEGTQSYAILMVDPDVPTEFENFNKEGAVMAADMPRQNFYHWVLVDIPAGMTSLQAGADTGEKSPKPIGETPHGVRGVNDYTKFMTADMAGEYGGYDGPCPPWNDERMHNYTFKVYALDVPSLGLSGAFTGADVEKAMEGHVLAQGEVTGTYTLNPAMR
jgi:Raf kinase inhibitor-like YbhB/YbcL family protein